MWVTDDLGQVHLPSTHHQTKPMVADTVCVCVCVCVCMCSVMSDSCNPMDCSQPDFSVHGDSLGKNRLPFLPQGIFPTRGSNPHLLHCRWILYPLSHLGSPADIISGHLGFQKKKDTEVFQKRVGGILVNPHMNKQQLVVCLSS